MDYESCQTYPSGLSCGRPDTVPADHRVQTLWELSNMVAKALRDEGLLQGMTNDQLIPYLRALVRSSKTFMVESDFVTVINEK